MVALIIWAAFDDCRSMRTASEALEQCDGLGLDYFQLQLATFRRKYCTVNESNSKYMPHLIGILALSMQKCRESP